MKTALEAFTPYVSFWVTQTQSLRDLEALLARHHQGQWGDADPRDRVANEHNLARQRGPIVSVFYSASHHRRPLLDHHRGGPLLHLHSAAGGILNLHAPPIRWGFS